MQNLVGEIQTKCRRITYAKIDVPEIGILAGQVIDIWSGGGAIEELTGDDLMESRYNDPMASTWYGCIEEFFSTNPVRKPIQIDLAKTQACHDAVDGHRAAVRAEKDFVFEEGIRLFNSAPKSTEDFRHNLKVQESASRHQGQDETHAALI